MEVRVKPLFGAVLIGLTLLMLARLLQGLSDVTAAVTAVLR